MGAVKIWDAMEVAEEARENCCSEIHSSHTTVDTSLSFPQMTPKIIELCKDLFKKWSNLDDSQFSVETISGGITNLLLKVSVKEENGNSTCMTVRLYGPNTEYVINRERELQFMRRNFGTEWSDGWQGKLICFQFIQLLAFLIIHLLFVELHAIGYLSAAGFGAKLLGVFGNGMVQSFINARTLTPSDMKMPKLAAEIAKQLRKFHQVEIPGSKEPQLWIDIFKFFEKASTLKFDDMRSRRKPVYVCMCLLFLLGSGWGIRCEIVISCAVFEILLIWMAHLKNYTELYQIGIKLDKLPVLFRCARTKIQCELTDCLNSPVVFAHNDLLSGNLMLNDDEVTEALTLEITSMNMQAMTVTTAYTQTKNEQYHFFRHYLAPDKPNEVSDKDLETLYVEANTFMLASHLYWALWALIQAKMSPIDFDYLGYYFLRYEEYTKQKEKCLSLARSYLSASRDE
ncbi:putative ethanolamine kinase [Vitis vinifera]|uniref:ethanolamine kinase n=1 Tax=Vitis vinifera TaxID=29760 RepID=A0A438JQG0_VITVI|nr:putative ethanolamine kinase [Vitis vinifera]